MTDTHSDILRQRTQFHPVRALAGFLLLPTILIVALAVFGHPGMRITYTWNGNAAQPHYYSCDYITVTGWKRRAAHCGLFETFPVTFLPNWR